MVPFPHSLPAIEEAITAAILYYGKLLRAISTAAHLVHTFNSAPDLESQVLSGLASGLRLLNDYF